MRPLSIVLMLVLSAAPALAQQPIHQSVERAAARIASEQAGAPTSHRPLMRSGVVLAAAGSVVAILGATAFKSEDTTSGNAPDGSFQSCEALKANPVYAGNRCDVLKGPNAAMIWSGIAVAAAGVTLMVAGAPRASIVVAPGRVKATVKLGIRN